METVSCPSCGAPVQFRSHASVMAVCEFCRAAVIKDADSVKDMGKISAVLEDYSPIQIGTSGSFGGRTFNVVGRIQQRYEQGLWNEWFLMFDDGSTSWLGDASGMYTITTAREATPPLPDFHTIVPGQQYQIGAERFIAADKRTGECIGGQGELPFRVGDGWSIRVADFRKGSAFVTLDYTDGEIPVLYNGMAVTLPELRCQLLRDDDQIKASAGRYRARVDALDCPSCGSMIKYVPGVTATLVCPGCASQLDASGPEATVLAAGEQVAKIFNTLTLGATAVIGGSEHTVIGAMVRLDEEGSEWTEYLVYSARNGFFWLVESDEGWFRATVQPSWPEMTSLGADAVKLENIVYTKLYDYTATVRHAAGAFNWRVKAGDTVRVSEYENGQTTLAAELTPDELTWSRSTPVPTDQLKAWFGDAFTGVAPTAARAPASLRSTQLKFVWWILGLNAIPMLFAFGETFFMVIAALVGLFYPASYFQGDEDD